MHLTQQVAYIVSLQDCYEIHELFRRVDEPVQNIVPTAGSSLSVTLEEGRKIMMVRDLELPFRKLVKLLIGMKVEDRVLEAWLHSLSALEWSRSEPPPATTVRAEPLKIWHPMLFAGSPRLSA